MLSALLGLCIMYYFTFGVRRKRPVLLVVPSRTGSLTEDGDRGRLRNVVSSKIYDDGYVQKSYHFVILF
jgi:hypothetical protein